MYMGEALKLRLEEEGVLVAQEAWTKAGIECEIIHTGGGCYALVAQLEDGLEAVQSEMGFGIYVNEEWNIWLKHTDKVPYDDFAAQVSWIKFVQGHPNREWQLSE